MSNEGFTEKQIDALNNGVALGSGMMQAKSVRCLDDDLPDSLAMDSSELVPVDSVTSESLPFVVDPCVFSTLSCDNFKHLYDGFGIISVDLLDDLCYVINIEIDRVRSSVR